MPDHNPPSPRHAPIKAFFNEKYEVPQMRLRTTIYKHKVWLFQVEVEDEG
jgi:hypothetical protein